MIIMVDLTTTFFIIFANAVAGTAGKCFNISQNEDGLSCQAVNISCPPGHVIYDPNVTASDQSCSNNSVSSKPNPDLMVELSNCYWKSSCVISFPSAPMLYTWSDPKSLHVNNWDCIDPSVNDQSYMGFMCDSKTNIGSKIDHGMFRSHEQFPWKYDSTSFNTIQSMDIACTKTFHLPSSGDDKFLVSVDSFDVDCDNDDFTLNGIKVEKDFKQIYTSADTKIEFNFKVNRFKTKGGSGFVVCIKKFSGADVGNIWKYQSACDGMASSTYQPITEVRSPNSFCGEENELLSTENFQSSTGDGMHQKCGKIQNSFISSITPTVKTTVKPDISSASTNESPFCVKCLKRKKLGKKCIRSCCKGKIISPKCSSKGQSNIQDGKKTENGICPVPTRKVNRLCKKCSSKTKCRGKFLRRCKACCADKSDNLSKCKPNNSRRNRKKHRGKGRKNRRRRKHAKNGKNRKG